MKRINKKKPTRAEKLKRTAWHEAGHAVAAFFLKRKFHYITIVPDKEGDRLGHVYFHLLDPDFEPEIDDQQEWLPLAINEILISLSGQAAECLLTGRNSWRDYHDPDMEKAAAFAKCYCPDSEKEFPQMSRWLWLRAKRLVATPLWYHQVKAVASELLKRKTIKYDEFLTIMRREPDSKAMKEWIKKAKELEKPHKKNSQVVGLRLRKENRHHETSRISDQEGQAVLSRVSVAPDEEANLGRQLLDPSRGKETPDRGSGRDRQGQLP